MFLPTGDHFKFDLLTRAWSYYQRQPGIWLAATGIACGVEFGVVRLLLELHPVSDSRWAILVAILAGTIHRTFLTGLCRIALAQLRGEPAPLRLLIAPRAGFGRTLGTFALVAVCVQVAYSVFFVGGLILNTLLMLLEPILADRRTGLKAAVELSARTIQAELLTALTFSGILGWLASLGGAFFGSSIALSTVLIYPMVPLALALLYRSFFPYSRYDAVE